MTAQAMHRPQTQDTPVALASLLCVAALIVMIGWLMQQPGMLAVASSYTRQSQAVDANQDPAGHASQYGQKEIDTRFLQAVAMLHAKQYDNAVTALHRVLRLAPRMPEAH